MSEKPQNAIKHFNGVFHAIDIVYSEAVQEIDNAVAYLKTRRGVDEALKNIDIASGTLKDLNRLAEQLDAFFEEHYGDKR